MSVQQTGGLTKGAQTAAGATVRVAARRQRIVLLSGALKVSGSTTWILNLHRGLLAAGAEVVHLVVSDETDFRPTVGRVVYTGRARGATWLRTFRCLQLHKVLPAAYARLEAAEYDRRVAAALAEIGWQDGVDLVIKDISGRLPGLLARFPVAAVIHRVMSFSSRPAGGMRPSRVRYLVPVSQTAGEDARRFGMEPTAPIYNPIDRALVERRSVTFNPGLARPYIVFVGRLIRSKGVHDLLAAFARIARADIDLVYVGRGAEETALREAVSRLGLGARVHFTGFQANPYPYIRHAQVLALPSRSEAMPYVPIEAAVLGVPVVLGGFESAAEFFEPDVIVELAPADSFVDRLAFRLAAALDNRHAPGLKAAVAAQLEPLAVARAYLALAERRARTATEEGHEDLRAEV